MKRCPKCHNTYTDATLIYCLQDGATLVSSDTPTNASEAETLQISGAQNETLVKGNIEPKVLDKRARATLLIEISENLDMLEELWRPIAEMLKSHEKQPNKGIPETYVQIRDLKLPKWKMDKWNSLFTRSRDFLKDEEYYEVLEFYSCLERLTGLREFPALDKWIRDARLIIPTLIESGNPLDI